MRDRDNECTGDQNCQHVCPEVGPLPPTAEQTSIARFNALADQIRELKTEMLHQFEVLVSCQTVPINERGREHSRAITALCDSQTELHKTLDLILNSKKECPDAEMCGCVTHCEHDHPKPRALTKHAKAPLVRKKKGKK